MTALAFMAGVTWLALLGAATGWSIVSPSVASTLAVLDPRTHFFTTYQVDQPALTSFGALTVAGVRVDPADISVALPPDQALVQISLNVSNQQDGMVESPRVENFHLVTERGGQADSLDRLWSGPAILYPQSNYTMQLAFVAPRDGSDLWLEYRAGHGQSPIRIALGEAA